MPNFVRSQVNIEVAPNGAIIHDPTVSNTGIISPTLSKPGTLFLRKATAFPTLFPEVVYLQFKALARKFQAEVCISI